MEVFFPICPTQVVSSPLLAACKWKLSKGGAMGAKLGLEPAYQSPGITGPRDSVLGEGWPLWGGSGPRRQRGTLLARGQASPNLGLVCLLAAVCPGALTRLSEWKAPPLVPGRAQHGQPVLVLGPHTGAAGPLGERGHGKGAGCRGREGQGRRSRRQGDFGWKLQGGEHPLGGGSRPRRTNSGSTGPKAGAGPAGSSTARGRRSMTWGGWRTGPRTRAGHLARLRSRHWSSQRGRLGT